MSIRTTHTKLYGCCEISEVECVEPSGEKHVGWEVSCLYCSGLYANHLTEEEAFSEVENHVCGQEDNTGDETNVD